MTKAVSKHLQLSLSLVLTVIILYYGKIVLVPLALAGILAMLFVIPSEWLEKKGVPRWASALIAIIILVLCLTGLGLLLSWQVRGFAEQLGTMQHNLSELITKIQMWIQSSIGIDPEKQKTIAQEQIKNTAANGGMAQQLASAFMGTFLDFILVVVYLYLLLFYRVRLKKFLIKITPLQHRGRTIEIVDSASLVAANYVSGLSKMIVVLWILYGIGFTAIGVENALFFAIICGILELIPFIGNLTGTVIAILGVTAQGGDANIIIGVVAIYATVQFVQTYLLEPLIVGNQVNINPLFTILCLVTAEALWGIPGMILAIPIMGIIKIVCDRIPDWKPLGYLIGTDKKPKTWPWKSKK